MAILRTMFGLAAALVCALAIGAQPPDNAESGFAAHDWQWARAFERAHWSTALLRQARAYSDSIHSSSVMIVQAGRIIDQWGPVDRKISSFSVRKSLISALYGVYAHDGVIDPNSTLAELGIDDAPDRLTSEEKQARGIGNAQFGPLLKLILDAGPH